MLKIRNRINLIGNALDIALNDDKYLIVDQNYRIYKFSLKEFMFSFSKRVAKNTPSHHLYSKALSCSKDGYVLIVKKGNPVGLIYLIEEDKILLATRLKWHRADICVSKFSDDSKYLATGGEDGRVFVYTHPNHRLNTFFPRRPDYISGIAFGKSSANICYTSYDLSLIVYDLKTDTQIGVTNTPSVVEDLLFFAQDKKIFYVCKNGESGIFDIAEAKNEYKKSFSTWPTRVMLSFDEQYVFVGTRDETLYVQSLKNNSIFLTIELELKGVSSIKGFENLIFICFSDGHIQIIDKFYKIDEFLALLNQNDFKQAKILAEQSNILLKTLEIYTNVKNTSWEKVKKEAIELLSENKIEQILELTTPYFEDIEKENEIKNYILERDFVQKFLDRYEERSYRFAYEIASSHPNIKNLAEYKQMEDEFDKICNVSNYLVYPDALTGKDKIQTLLEPFSHVPEKKKIIVNILNNWDKYVLAEKYAKEKDFLNYFLLARECPLIQKSRTYQKMYLVCENITHQIQGFVMDRDYRQAERYVNFLSEIEPFKEFATKTQNYLNNIEIFLEKCKTKSYTECYEIVKLFPEMSSIEEYIEVNDEITQIFEEAKNIAQTGDTKQTYLKIQKFFNVPDWKNKVDIVMKIAYLYEMQNALKSKADDIDWQESIKQYISRYGSDDEILAFCNLEENFLGVLENLSQTSQNHLNKNINHVESIIFRKNQANIGT